MSSLVLHDINSATICWQLAALRASRLRSVCFLVETQSNLLNYLFVLDVLVSHLDQFRYYPYQSLVADTIRKVFFLSHRVWLVISSEPAAKLG